jgi:hypothetical protein
MDLTRAGTSRGRRQLLKIWIGIVCGLIIAAASIIGGHYGWGSARPLASGIAFGLACICTSRCRNCVAVLALILVGVVRAWVLLYAVWS